jgi:hypothetical protein
MDQADSVHSTPPINTSVLPDEKPTSEAPGSLADALYFPTDITPEELFQEIGRIRREARDAIKQMIDLLDRTDAFYDEREQQIDDGPIDGDDDSEESLGSIDVANQTRWSSGEAGDREGDGCADDREGDELEHGGESEREDDEPSLGWTEDRQVIGLGNCHDLEIAPSTLTEKARARHRQFDRYAVNRDGRHVDSERMLWAPRIRNLSDRQRAILGPKIDRDAVSI